ncbi:Glycosyltransferase 2-like [uncultured Caudovirales phage]|uniref:Glycosyltransferase 2-like n=1 Tax=uncultured Caudovirales phage TaxID=2100421 RepID=A0A6J5RL31_9CAUD|nr:Glycosyltransferase 2-like [uncultured Caudovirales phage]CAB4189352.1 Glycosyltransferase 2-like [uncultured Caudovirales phage]CAB4192474.1 Glycosyltransferase 2-like [uncultured Caudovirales phage]CAB4215306.1 Glycosyltransferase 2-like [uncultured Caudovirales phage]CAB5238905.1 Glycosyltransferase 2-like [uncultured Caudovirales phage]
MRIAVLTLTRDRLDFTRRSFKSLHDTAGIEFDHFVIDQGSTDGTPEWLRDEYQPHHLTLLDHNIGISPGTNTLIREAGDDYDIIVRFDNDCEVETPGTLAHVADLTYRYGLLLSPTILGLRNPPPTIGKPLSLGGSLVDEKHQIGGVFLVAPADLYTTDGFRYADSNPKWGGDDVQVCQWWRSQGGSCGYVQGYNAYHATALQEQADPVYFSRKKQEMGLS